MEAAEAQVVSSSQTITAEGEFSDLLEINVEISRLLGLDSEPT